MPKFIAVRGINARRYFMTQVEANTPEEAFTAARALLEPEHAGKWSPDYDRSDNHNSMGHINDLLEPPTASEETLSITDETNELHTEFTDIPNEVEPACYTNLLAFARRMAQMTTPEDEFSEDPGDYKNAEELEGDLGSDRLFDEYQAFMAMVRDARALIKFPKEAPAPASVGTDASSQGAIGDRRLFKVVQTRDALHVLEAFVFSDGAESALAIAEGGRLQWNLVDTMDLDGRDLEVFDANDEHEECVLAKKES